MRWDRAARRPLLEAALLAILATAVAVAWLAPGFRRTGNTAPTRLTAREARLANAAIPFVAGPIAPAPRYRFRGSAAARTQAIDCLATAALYEAGDDGEGQRAIMQVVLNRVRRPGYPQTVCGVVYQGSALPSGCQFSFACDGSVLRRPEHAGWIRARARAERALSGAVYAGVGGATHYHADYVLPYWIGSLDKLAAVGPHIFYRPRDRTPDGPDAAGTAIASRSVR